MVERPVAASWAGRRLVDLDLPGLARVAALSRLGVGQVPDTTLVTQEGDVVYMTVGTDQIEELDAHLAGTPSGGGS
jgi:trk system potassium uptake protein TrkA